MKAALASWLLVSLLATGCAATQTALPAGIVLHEGDEARCAAAGCTVWTEDELVAFGRYLVDRSCRRGSAI